VYYSSKGRPFSGEIPELQDPRWRKWTRALFTFLNRPRTWEELGEWASEHRVDGHFLRHQLAWLEDRKLAASKPPREKKGSWIWFNRNAAKKKRRRRKKKRVAPALKNLVQRALRNVRRTGTD